MDENDTSIMTPGADEQAAGTATRQGGPSDVMGRSAAGEVMGPDAGLPETVGDVMGPGARQPGLTGLIPEQGKVRDIMTAAPVGVYYSQTIGETARVMRDSEVGSVLVVSDGALAGLVTDRDLVVRGLAEGMGPDAPVGPLCSGDLIGVAADAELGQAAQLMRDNAVRRLPVINDGQVVGIVSMGDIAISEDSDSALAAVSRAAANM